MIPRIGQSLRKTLHHPSPLQLLWSHERNCRVEHTNGIFKYIIPVYSENVGQHIRTKRTAHGIEIEFAVAEPEPPMEPIRLG